MPFSAGIGATDAARAGHTIVMLIDAIAAANHRAPVPGFGIQSSIAAVLLRRWRIQAIPQLMVLVRKTTVMGRFVVNDWLLWLGYAFAAVRTPRIAATQVDT
jgi:hypothetical protein